MNLSVRGKPSCSYSVVGVARKGGGWVLLPVCILSFFFLVSQPIALVVVTIEIVIGIITEYYICAASQWHLGALVRSFLSWGLYSDLFFIVCSGSYLINMRSPFSVT